MMRSLYGHQETARTPYEWASIWRIGKIAEKSVKYQEKVSLSNLLKEISKLTLKEKNQSSKLNFTTSITILMFWSMLEYNQKTHESGLSECKNCQRITALRNWLSNVWIIFGTEKLKV